MIFKVATSFDKLKKLRDWMDKNNIAYKVVETIDPFALRRQAAMQKKATDFGEKITGFVNADAFKRSDLATRLEAFARLQGSKNWDAYKIRMGGMNRAKEAYEYYLSRFGSEELSKEIEKLKR